MNPRYAPNLSHFGLYCRDIDAMTADSPVTGFAIKTSGGALQAAGDVFDAGPYGWAVAKDEVAAKAADKQEAAESPKPERRLRAVPGGKP